MNDSKNSINHFLNEVNNKIKLSDFVGQFVHLNEKGNSFVGKCPFHNENTPSFNVNNEKSLFYCFGCKAGGNILNFITKYKNLQFKEAVDFLSKYSGIPFFNESRIKLSSDEKIIFDINNEINIYFQKILLQNKQAYEYLRLRGVSQKVIQTFNIGYCPDEKLIIRYLQEKGFKSEEIKKTDLLIKNKNNEYFGRFSNRITFPIYNFFNNIVGFGGRTIKNSKIKYINSQENLVFKKSKILFGLYQNNEQIRFDKEIILVEGYMDVIKLYNSDIKNAVSSLGTTLSEIQLKKMWNFTDIPYICFDGDEAGVDASKKIAQKILKFLVPGKSLKFITLPNKSDPDSFMKENSKKEFLELKSEAKDLSLLIWEMIEESIETDTPEFLAILDEKINNFIDKIEDPKVAKEYNRFLKSRKDNFIWDKNRFKGNSSKNSYTEKIIENINEKLFLYMLITEKKFFLEFQEEIFETHLLDADLEIEKKRVLKNFTDPNIKELLTIKEYQNLNPTLYEEINELRKTHLIILTEEEKKSVFKQILNNLRLPILLNERKLIQKEILETNDNIISDNLLKKYNKISEEIKNIQIKAIE